jgi:pyruvate dehydrogenase E1 component alpha subunit
MKTKAKQKLAGSPPGQKEFSLIRNQKLLDLYVAMLKCRMIGDHARSRFRKSKLARGLAPAAVHEASGAGVILELLPEDALSLTAGNPIPGFLKNQPLRETLSALKRGTASAASGSLGILPPAEAIAARLHVAIGIALANKLNRNRRIVAVFCEATAATLRSSPEALRFASMHALPILFVFESTGSGNSEAAASNWEACNIPHICVDGNDVVGIYRVAHESIELARRGSGPTLIECKAESGDAIENMEQYLKRKGLFDEQTKRKTMAAFKKELDAALRRPRK